MEARAQAVAGPFFNPLLEQAIELAAQWHDATYRKGRWRPPVYEAPDEAVLRIPAMAHVTTVALMVQRAGWDDVTVAAAFLHDVLEDPNRYDQIYPRDRLEALMGPGVAALVATVTEQKLDVHGQRRSWRQRKEGYLLQLQTGRAEAMAISLADKIHNLWVMNESLARGIDIFTPGPHRKALNAGPAEQLWFQEAILAAAQAHDDLRIGSLVTRLDEETRRFARLTEQH